MFETTLAGSLPKPAWLSETQKLWPQWKLAGDDLAAAKLDATLLWITAQEDAGLDMQWVPKDRLFACTNCGLAPMGREVAEKKLLALALARERYC